MSGRAMEERLGDIFLCAPVFLSINCIYENFISKVFWLVGKTSLFWRRVSRALCQRHLRAEKGSSV